MYDVMIIGGGVAGMSASIYSASRGLETIIFESGALGGVIGRVSTVSHYAGIISGETGASFVNRIVRQTEELGVKLRRETVSGVSLDGPVKKVITSAGVYEGKTVIIASGLIPRKLGVPGEEKFTGNGVYYDTGEYAGGGNNIFVVGGSDGAVKEALFLSQSSKHVEIIHWEEKLGSIREFTDKVADRGNISVRLNARLLGIKGTDRIDAIVFRDERDGRTEEIPATDARVFIFAGSIPDTSLYKPLVLKDGYIVTDESMYSGIPGVFAAGDIRLKKIRQIATAVSDGAVASISAKAYIDSMFKKGIN
jgi:thioredoxin reductase (NADPH)